MESMKQQLLNNRSHDHANDTITRGQALDVSVIDNELLKLLLPKIQSMFKYLPQQYEHEQRVLLPLRSINADALHSYDKHDYSSILANDDAATESMSNSASLPVNENNDYNHDNDRAQNEIIGTTGIHQEVQQIRSQIDPNPASRYITKVIFYLLKGIMIYSTLFYDKPTPGMLYVRTSYKPPTSRSLFLHHKDRIGHYFILSTILPLIHELLKWKRWCYQHEMLRNILSERHSYNYNDNNTHHRDHRLIGVKRKLSLLNYILHITSCIVHPLQLYVYTLHLLCHTASPTLPMYLTGLQYSTTTNTLSSYKSPSLLLQHQSFNFSYAQRRLWYEEMVLTCGMLLPLEIWRDGPSIIRAYLKKCRRRIKFMFSMMFYNRQLQNNNSNTDIQINCNNKCAICLIEPIPIPYQTCCNHMYCYTCLHHEIMESGPMNYRCEICGTKVISSQPII